MSETATLLTGQTLEAATPSSARAKPRRRPTAEFILTLTVLADVLVIFAALRLGFWLRFESGLIPIFSDIKNAPTAGDYIGLLSMGTIFLSATFSYLRLYSRRASMRYFQTAKVVIQGAIFWLFAYLAISLILKFDPPISRLFMVSSFGCVLIVMLSWRYIYFRIIHHEFLAITLRQRVMFVGWGREADQLEMEIRNGCAQSYEVIGCVPSPQGRLDPHPPSSVPILGDYYSLGGLLERRCADIVILADLYVPTDEIIGLVNLCEMEFAQFKLIPSYFQILASGLRLETISSVPILGVSELPLDHFSNRIIKRFIDIAGATLGLLFSVPLIALFGGLVYGESPGRIIYSQKRTGKNGEIFQLFKIRSMRTDAEEHGVQWAEENDPRRLRIGAFMRKWNLDEVPQYWNVLKGEMSLVGPRPERPELISQFKNNIPHYHARHTCLPGMTGWAQVNGWRGNTNLEERIRYDIWYVENWSVALDFRIMILTLFRRKNAY